MSPGIRSPYPWFGGKRRCADLIWQRLGDVANYVEPFLGSAAVLLARPSEPRIETVNDADALLANFWRAVQQDPAGVAAHADWPVNEADLHARHLWLVRRKPEIREAAMSDPDWCDAKAAGWWVWGLSQWIGSGWCDEKVQRPDKTEHKRPSVGGGSSSHAGRGVHRVGVTAKRPHLGASGSGSGSGVHSAGALTWQQRPDVSGNTHGRGINAQIPRCNGLGGQGIHGARVAGKMPNLSAGFSSGCGVHAVELHRAAGIHAWFASLQERLRRVRVCCGDWKRITGDSVIFGNGMTGIVLDPPYDGHASLYADGNEVFREAAAWAVERGADPRLRIILCGYEGHFTPPPGWATVSWKANGGYGNVAGNQNKHRERLWCSPACLLPQQGQLELLAVG